MSDAMTQHLPRCKSHRGQKTALSLLGCLSCFLGLVGCTPQPVSKANERGAAASPASTPIHQEAPPSPAFHCPRFAPPKAIGLIRDSRLSEISGVVASQKHPGVLWTHNDSGDSANVYALKLNGGLLKTFHLKTRARDWEDIALLVRPKRPDYLFIGDIGDNLSHRKQGILVHRFKEPKSPYPRSSKKKAQSAVIKKFDTMRLVYPESPQDAEAFVVDPWTEQILIITKPRIGWPKVYSVDSFSKKKQTLKLETTLSPEQSGVMIHLVTAADISPDGHWILLRTYLGVFLFYRDEKQSVAEALRGKACSLDPPEEAQGEALSFLPSTAPKATQGRKPPGFLTVSEGLNAALYRILPLKSE